MLQIFQMDPTETVYLKKIQKKNVCKNTVKVKRVFLLE